jgi:hypothetical protein
MTDENPWNPMKVNLSPVSTRPQGMSIELATYASICDTDAIQSDDDQGSGLMVYNQTKMMNRMISAVNIATAYHEKHVSIAFIGAKDCHSQVSAKTIAQKFHYGLETAQKTFKATTQRGICHATHPLHQSII